VVVAKIVLLLVLINLGAFNRYVSVPLLQEWAGIFAEGRGFFTRIAVRVFPRLELKKDGYQIALRFMRIVRVEAVLIIALLLCAALLRHEIPARHLAHMGHGAANHPNAGGSVDHHMDHHDH